MNNIVIYICTAFYVGKCLKCVLSGLCIKLYMLSVEKFVDKRGENVLSAHEACKIYLKHSL